MIKKILFVCTGNICRSPMSEYYLRKRLADEDISGVEIDSAGTFALGSNSASLETQQIMESIGVPLADHRSSPITLEKLRAADLILVMEKDHKELIENRMPRMAHKVKLLGSYIKGEEEEVIDPYGYEKEVHQQSFQQIQDAVENLIKEISTEWD